MKMSKMDVINGKIEKLTKPGFKIRVNVNNVSFSFEIIVMNIKTSEFKCMRLNGFELESIGLDNIINRIYAEFDKEEQ
jgi:hypothetical protein